MSLNVISEFVLEGTPYKFEVMIKPAKSLSVDDLAKTENGKKMVYQMFNNLIKQVLREKDMDELTRGKFFNKKEIMVKEVGLSVIRGYKFTLCTLKSGLALQIDVCSRVFRSENLLEELSAHKSKDFARSLNDAIVITLYGRRRTYKIININYDMTPNDKFYHDKRAGQISYADYYKENYGLKISAKNQPMIEVVIREERKVLPTGEMEIKEIKGFLIPEFVALTGMSDEQRADYKTMREIAPFTKLEPSQRMDSTNQIIDVLNASGRFRVDQPRRIKAFQLQQPYVKVFNNNVVKNHGDGQMNIRDKLRNSVAFKDWVVVYSYGKNTKFDDQDADNLVSILTKASEAFNVKFSEPGFITCDPQMASWKSELKADIEKNGKPQIIVLYFNPFEEKFYGEMKRYITCELKIPCQAVRRRTITKAKNPMSAASKIVVQMNQKAGGTAWEIIPQENAYTSKMRTMYGSFAISKGKKGFTLAFTGTLDPLFTRIFNYCKTGYKNKEAIPVEDFELILVTWAKNYVGVNKKGPELIMIYREGLSTQQIQRQVKDELRALNNVIKKIGQKTGNANYNPEIVYTVVNTKLNVRIFDLSEGSSQSHSNKFQPKVTNPQSGTCVLDELSIDEMYDFHLTAQRVTEGTCTPTHYIVAHNTSKLPQEQLVQFTYEQCFNYYNWTGAVKVPATLQCANKLAKLVGESIQTDVITGEVLTSFYFL
jgi:aubergine